MSTTTNLLITGANRGLGLGLNIIAFVRDPSSPSSQALDTLPKADNTNIIIIPYDASRWDSAAQAVKILQTNHKITKIHTIIANAGIAKVYPLIKDVRKKDIQEHFEINVLGPVALFQATRDLLHAAKEQNPEKEPIFAWMGSGAGSLSNGPGVPSAAYAPTKTMLNWYGVRLHTEEDWLVSFIIDPGWVQTEMGNSAAHLWGLKHANLTVDQSVDGIYEVVRGATRERYGGRLMEYTGRVQDW